MNGGSATNAAVVVVLTAFYLLILGGTSLFMPDRASRFLLGFAGSRSAHYLELALRLLAGAGLVLYAPRMLFSAAFQLFGWVLVVTTAGLLLAPWQWNRRFAQRAVPRVTRFMRAIGAVSLFLAGLIMYSVAHGNTA